MIYSVSQVQKYMAEIYSGVNKKSKIYIDTSLIPELMIEIPLLVNQRIWIVGYMMNFYKVFIYPYASWVKIVKHLALRSKIEETKISNSFSNIFHSMKKRTDFELVPILTLLMSISFLWCLYFPFYFITNPLQRF